MNDKTYKIYIIGFFLILALPILNALPWFSNWLSPPDWGKTIIFRVVVSILIFLLLYEIFFSSPRRKNPTIVEFLQQRKDKKFLSFWLLIALLIVFLLATLFSENPSYSFFGDPHRAGGSLNFSFYIIFAFLAFFSIKENKWQKIWDFSIVIAILVSILALFQQYKILDNIFVSVEGRPFSTIGSPVLLGLYLLIFVFITLSFLIKSIKNLDRKWFFYLPALLLFLFTILIIASRSTYFGLLIGFIYFILAYPQKTRLIILSKILFLSIIILVVYGVYYVNTYNKLPDYLEKNQLIKNSILPRLFIKSALEDPRFSVWAISLEAIKEKPLLGYGPENFSIAFDKQYNPLFPYIDRAWGSWYDKAHNFLFDIAVTVGIPGLIIYICFFASLFWELDKRKSLVTHAIQATFLAYFANNLFVFDSFSSYLIIFLLIAYSLSLITNKASDKPDSSPLLSKYRNVIISLAFLILISFVWFLNLKPFIINKKANYALKNTNCEQSLIEMKETISSHSFLDHYLGIQYANIIGSCIKKYPGQNLKMAEDVIEVLEKNTKLRPNYTRNWLYLGIYNNFLIINNLSSIEQSEYYFSQANKLSPQRQEIFLEWSKTYFVTKDYIKAKEKTEKCIEMNPEAIIGECYWIKALSNIYLGNLRQAKIDLKTAENKRYDVWSKSSLLQLFEAYLETENYEELIPIHQELIKLEPDNSQYYTSLAYNYKMVKDYKNAEKIAKKILELFPELKDEVNEFLKTLK